MFCIECGSAVADTDNFCGKCGVSISAVHPSSSISAPSSAARPAVIDTDENTIRRLADYERISGYFWIVLGVLQIISIVCIIAGIWNVFAGRSKLKMAPRISARERDVPDAFEGFGMLIAIGAINLFFGGVIGIVFVIFDFFVRDKILSSRHLFTASAIAA